ncbi:MAG: hypothetical protein ACRETY_00715 [Steroidobacteraceae bacterium]
MTRHSLLICLIGLTSVFGAAKAQDSLPVATPAVRVGIVLPKAQLGQGNTGQDVAEPVRQLIISYMSGPVLALVPLQSKIPAQVQAEAQAQSCTHLLYTSVEQKKTGKGMGLGKVFGMLAPAASMLPAMGGLGSSSGAMIAGAATQVAATAAMQSAQDDVIASLSQAQAGSVKARDEITLAYQLVTVSGAKPPLEAKLTAKAESDGQDLLGPLVEQVATAAVTAATQP